jgi:hypothetical protein
MNPRITLWPADALEDVAQCQVSLLLSGEPQADDSHLLAAQNLSGRPDLPNYSKSLNNWRVNGSNELNSGLSDRRAVLGVRPDSWRRADPANDSPKSGDSLLSTEAVVPYARDSGKTGNVSSVGMGRSHQIVMYCY